MTIPEKVTLGEVQETLLIPLYMRAKETKSENPKIKDQEAVELVEKIDYDFRKFESGEGSYLGIVSRTMILDREVQKYIDEHLTNCIIINIGCGLCTRNIRLDLKQAKWYNLDLPDVMAIREKFISRKENCFNVTKSLLDEDWPESIDTGDTEDILIIVEGVFMYFTEEEVKTFLNIVKNHFRKVTMIAEIMHKLVSHHTNFHDTVTKTKATFKWGVSHAKDVEKLVPGIKFITEWFFVDEIAHFGGGGPLMKLASKHHFLKNFGNKFGVYEITQTN